MLVIVGIDIGNVIVRTDTEVEGEPLEVEVDGAIDAIRAIVEDGNTVWLVSKCYENMQKRTRKWLDKIDFYKRTGVDKGRVLFCTERHHKAIIAQGLHLDAFIDDRPQCLLPMHELCPTMDLFLFGAETTTAPLIAMPGWGVPVRVPGNML